MQLLTKFLIATVVGIAILVGSAWFAVSRTTTAWFEKDIGLRIMSRFHYRPDVQIMTCETVAEAEEILKQQITDAPSH